MVFDDIICTDLLKRQFPKWYYLCSRNFKKGKNYEQIDFQHPDEVASLVEELTPDFIKEFAVYLSNDRGLASSTIWLSCMHLKGVVGRAHDNGKIQRNVFAQFLPCKRLKSITTSVPWT